MTDREKLIELLGVVLTDALMDEDCYPWIDKEPKIKAADYLIANGVTVQRWIPVADRLPEETVQVLAVDDEDWVMHLAARIGCPIGRSPTGCHCQSRRRRQQMARLRISCEIDGVAEDEHGSPCPAGLQIDLGEILKEVPYEELVKDISIPALLKGLCLDHIPASAARVIAPEEYDREYGENHPIQEANE